MGGDTSSTSEHVYTLPGGISSGDLLLVVTTTRNTRAFTYPDGWTQLFQTAYGSNMRMGAAYRVADGTEGSTITVTTNDGYSAYHAYVVYRITDYTGIPEVSEMETFNNSSPDPPSLAPSWGTANTLWLALAGADYGTTVSSYPTDYTDGDYWRGNSTSCATIMEAYREYSASSEDPDNFYIGISTSWCAIVIAIQPGTDFPNIPALKSPADGASGAEMPVRWAGRRGVCSHETSCWSIHLRCSPAYRTTPGLPA